VPDDIPGAYALPGFTGRIVVSTAMLHALPADERAVLLAHEAAHLTHRHHAYLLTAELAAAANPLVRPSLGAVRRAVERWADEAAAAEVGDRDLAARALARAGLARGVHAAGARPVRSPARTRSWPTECAPSCRVLRHRGPFWRPWSSLLCSSFCPRSPSLRT
jgi:Zn-dependent protease with chaperone function